jgi:hypothetical protein
VVGNDLGQLILDVLGVNRLSTDNGESFGGLVELALLDEITRRFREKSKTCGENDSPEELNSDRDTVRAGIATVLSGIGDASRKQDTDGDAELVTSNDSTTDLLGGNLGHVPVKWLASEMVN